MRCVAGSITSRSTWSASGCSSPSWATTAWGSSTSRPHKVLRTMDGIQASRRASAYVRVSRRDLCGERGRRLGARAARRGFRARSAGSSSASDADNVRVGRRTQDGCCVGYGKGALADHRSRQPARRSADIPPQRRIPKDSRSIGRRPKSSSTCRTPGRSRSSTSPREPRRRPCPRARSARTSRWPSTPRGPAGARHVPEPAAAVTYLRTLKGGALHKEVEACGDSDDVFVDAKRRSGLRQLRGGLRGRVRCARHGISCASAHIPTVPVVRTSFFVPELDRLFVAVRAFSERSPPAVWVFRPTP